MYNKHFRNEGNTIIQKHSPSKNVPSPFVRGKRINYNYLISDSIIFSNYRNAFLIIALIVKLKLPSTRYINISKYIKQVIYVFYSRVLCDSITRLHSKISTSNGLKLQSRRDSISSPRDAQQIFEAAIFWNSDFEILSSRKRPLFQFNDVIDWSSTEFVTRTT